RTRTPSVSWSTGWVTGSARSSPGSSQPVRSSSTGNDQIATAASSPRTTWRSCPRSPEASSEKEHRMKVGIGLPNPVPATPGHVLVDWARKAEERGFSSLATIDRIAYPSYESILALAAAAGATERIALLTNVLLGPTRNPVLLAKEAASLDQLAGGRFTLGIGVGARPDDYEAVGLDFHARGKRFDSDLELMHRVW